MEIRQNIDELIVAEWIAVDERCALEQSGDGRRRAQRANRMRGTLLETVEAAYREEAFGGVRDGLKPRQREFSHDDASGFTRSAPYRRSALNDPSAQPGGGDRRFARTRRAEEHMGAAIADERLPVQQPLASCSSMW